MSKICRLCGSTDAFTKYSIKEYTVLECSQCGFAYITPLDVQASIHALYKHRYFNSTEELGYRNYEKDSRIRAVTFSYYFRLIQKYLVRKKSVLDVGCSDGSFLRITQQNSFEKNEGIELNEEMFTAASKEFTVYDQPLELFDTKNQYDLITLFDVLEHIPDLKNACRKLHDICRRDGLLVILTPDYGSLARKVYGRKWFQFKPKEHINYFTRKRLIGLLSDNGFETLHAGRGVSLVDHEFINDRLRRYHYSFLGFLFSLFGRLFFLGRSHIKISNSSIFLIAKRVQ
ncbi:MAG: type 11 methyltransferase [Bacteroidetes bacterium]|jgi:2-polyprenyl-3-methyl-5-hydroxy-6-metoxy-1,4-benzoquinol methylase|nr:type 11 methyltransferase [Bacteroidota bacterium]